MGTGLSTPSSDQETRDMSAQDNRAEQAYRALEAMITFQELAPGSLVSEAALMDRTGYGRTPVREALQRLARERMVDIHPRRGVFIAQLSIESQLRLLELRRSIEVLAVRLAADRAEAAQIEAMLALDEALAAFTGEDIRAFGPLVSQSHHLVAMAAHNEYLSVAVAPLQGLSRRFWFANLRDVAGEIRAGRDLHCGILRAICQADAEKAAEASLRLNDYLTEFAYRTLHHR
jgi:DNA-binding GntR family transcriptional regulator